MLLRRTRLELAYSQARALVADFRARFANDETALGRLAEFVRLFDAKEVAYAELALRNAVDAELVRSSWGSRLTVRCV